MEKIKLSFIVRAYNAERTIRRTLESALAQTAQKDTYEIVVIDDGSKDETATIVRSLEDERIKLFQQDNKGVFAALETGLARAEGEHIILLDADDEALPATLQAAADAMKNEAFDYAYGDYLEEYNGVQKRVSASDPFKVPAGGIVWRRERILAAGGFNAETVFPEYEMLLRMWDTWKGVYIPQPFFVYHRSDASITGDKELIRRTIEQLRKKFPARAREIDLIRDYEPLAL